MDNMERLTNLTDKLMKGAQKLPPEKQLRLMWVMFSAVVYSLEQLNDYQKANFNAIAQYVEACGKVEENVMTARAKILEKLVEAVADSEEMFSE